MNRRGFLKVIGSVAAAFALPSAASATKLVDLAAPVPVGSTVLGYMREVFAYDLAWDRYIVRFDILAADAQWGVDITYASKEECNARLPHDREIAKQVLENSLAHDGKTWADLKPLPIPPGFERPDWVTT